MTLGWSTNLIAYAVGGGLKEIDDVFYLGVTLQGQIQEFWKGGVPPCERQKGRIQI